MDTERQIRFLIPPFVLLIWLILGAYLTDNIDLSPFTAQPTDQPSKSTAGPQLSYSIACTWPLVAFGVQAQHYLPPRTNTAPAANQKIKLTIPKDGCQALVGLLAVGTFVVAFGFILGTVTINVLRAGFGIAWIITRVVHKCRGIQKRKGCYFYEMWQFRSPTTHLLRGINGFTAKHKYTYYAWVSSDHDLSINNDNIHKWTMRRWNAFNTNSNCAMAILLSYLIVLALPGPMTQKLIWNSVSLAFGLLFAFNAIMAWHQTMKMIRFQSLRRTKKDEFVDT